VELGLRRITRLVASRGVGIRCRRQDERRGRLKLMLERRLFGRAARQGRAVGARGVYGLKLLVASQRIPGDDIGWRGWLGGSGKALTSSSVSRWKGQKSSSSSRSKERAASKSRRKATRLGCSTTNSLGVRTWRKCLLCCWAEARGALRDRPPWWLWLWALRCDG